jgi:hypothetical protein
VEKELGKDASHIYADFVFEERQNTFSPPLRQPFLLFFRQIYQLAINERAAQQMVSISNLKKKKWEIRNPFQSFEWNKYSNRSFLGKGTTSKSLAT